ncbi:hypothetical protein ABPG72_010851 [Tetrahymena utriculariae]
MPYFYKQNNFIEIITSFGFSISFGVMSYINSTVSQDNNIFILVCIQTFSLVLFISSYLKNTVQQFFRQKNNKLKNLRESSQKYWKKLQKLVLNNSTLQIQILKNFENEECQKIYQKYKIIKFQKVLSTAKM